MTGTTGRGQGQGQRRGGQAVEAIRERQQQQQQQQQRQQQRQQAILPNDLNAPTQRHCYHAKLLEFMSYHDKTTYPMSKTFDS